MKFSNADMIYDSDPLMRTRSEEVSLPLSSEDESVLRGMFEYVRLSTDRKKAKKYRLSPSVGLSAVQVGIPKRMSAVYIDVTDSQGVHIHHEYMLVNPVILSSSLQKAYLSAGEGCLSVPQKHEGHAIRSARVKVKAFDLCTGKETVIRAKGFLAVVLQHEIDHLDGILYYDRIDPEDPFRIPAFSLEI